MPTLGLFIVTKCSVEGLSVISSFVLTFTKMPHVSAVASFVVFALILVVTVGTGVYYTWVNRGQRSSRDSLTGGHSLTTLPVSLSLTDSYLSAVVVLTNPAEVTAHRPFMHESKKHLFLIIDFF